MAMYIDFVIVQSKWRWKKRTPGRNRYAGGSVRSNRERFLVMRYCKGRLKILLYNVLGKNCLKNKGYIFGN